MIHTLIYIDPGSGSYLIQVIIGAVLGVAVYFKTILLKIKTLFGRRKKEQEPENPEEHD
jgi:hypothetical protein